MPEGTRAHPVRRWGIVPVIVKWEWGNGRQARRRYWAVYDSRTDRTDRRFEDQARALGEATRYELQEKPGR